MSRASTRVPRSRNNPGKLPLAEPIGLYALSKFMDTILTSRRVKGDHFPLSALIDQYPASEERNLFSRYRNADAVYIISSVTRSFVSEFTDMIIEDGIRYFIIPNKDYFLQNSSGDRWELLRMLHDLRVKEMGNGIRCGFICALPHSRYGRLVDFWKKWMFHISRLFPFLIGNVSEDIHGQVQGRVVRRKPFVLDPQEKVDVTITKRLSYEISLLRFFIREGGDSFYYGVTLNTLVLFAKSHALLRGDTRVTKADIKFIEALVPFWWEPGGNDCQFFIIKNLPATFDQLQDKLPYPGWRIDAELQGLVERGLILRHGKEENEYYEFIDWKDLRYDESE